VFELSQYFGADAFTPQHEAPTGNATWLAQLGAQVIRTPRAAAAAELIAWNWADAAVRAHVAAAMAAAHALASADAVIDCVAWCHAAQYEYLVTTRAGGSAQLDADVATWPPPPCAPRADGGANAGGAAARRFRGLERALASVSASRWVLVRQWGPRVGVPVRKWHMSWLGVSQPAGLGFECALVAVLLVARSIPDPHLTETHT
jgi:hypothetical protein